MRKEIFFYHQNKNKQENIHNWKNKRCDNFEQKKKGTKFYKNNENNYRGYQGNNYKNYKESNPAAIKERETPTAFNKNTAQREPLNNWECCHISLNISP